MTIGDTMNGSSKFIIPTDITMGQISSLTITRNTGEDIYTVDLPIAFIHLNNLFFHKHMILPKDESMDILDALITAVSMSTVTQDTLQEQVGRVAMIPILASFISSVNMQDVQSLLNVLTALLQELYRADTIYSFSTADRVVNIVGEHIIIKRKRQ